MFLEQVLKERPWSPSKVQLLDKCALAYSLRYREKVKDERPSGKEARIGTTTHALYEWGLRDDLPKEDEVLGDPTQRGTGAPTVVPVAEHSEAALDERLGYLLDLFARSPRNQLSEEELDTARGYLPRVKSFILGMQRLAVKHGVTEFYLEHCAALDAELRPCDYGSPDALMRGVVDMGYRTRDGLYVVIDHKTGKPKHLGEYADQLKTYMLFAVANHPDVIGVQCGINHVRKEKVDWDEPVTREYIERAVRPWLQQYLNLAGLKIAALDAGKPRPKTSPLCNWCDYADFTTERKLGFAEGDKPVCPKGIAAIEAKPLGPRLERMKRGLPIVGNLP